jgi:hypothetical protein
VTTGRWKRLPFGLHLRRHAGRPGQRAGWEYFSAPAGVNQRRYEALRAYFDNALDYSAEIADVFDSKKNCLARGH